MTKREFTASSQERLDFLLKFIPLDLAQVREGEWLDLLEDVGRFLLPPAAWVAGPAPDAYAAELARRKETFPAPAVDPRRVTDRALVGRVQAALRTGMEQLSGGLCWEVPVDRSPAVWYEPQDDGTLRRRYRTIKLETAILIETGEALADAWGQIRLCKYEPCGKLFRVTHGLKKYCTTKHSGLARWYRLPEDQRTRKRDYKQETINANRREALKKKTAKKRGKK
jgi:hypothetical protein